MSATTTRLKSVNIFNPQHVTDSVNLGPIIAIGGNEDKSGTPESILNLFVERAGGASARIVIVPFASAHPLERGATYKRLFESLGAAEVVVLEDGGLANTDFCPVANATGIFVTGGDQEKLMLLLSREGYVDAIRTAVSRGAVYAGTSAGAAAVSGPMITGWSRNGRSMKVRFGEGLAIAKGVIVDQHFSERSRLPRLMSAVREWKVTGVGIDENTAAVWDAGRLSIHGAGTVTIVEADHHEESVHRTLRDGDTLELAYMDDGATLVR